MTEENSGRGAAEGGGKLDDMTVKLLVKALAVSPGDWDTRSHLVSHYLAAGDAQRAKELIQAAPTPPEGEGNLLLCARVDSETDPSRAVQGLLAILQQNKACARAYLMLAQVYRKQGLDEEARRKYGAATLLDEGLTDPEWEAWVGQNAAPVRPRPPSAVPAGGGLASEEVTAEDIAEALEGVAAPDVPARPRISFKDIGGMAAVKEQIRMNIIYPFKNPEVFLKFNRAPGGGILLYGPPGCGKTYIARATAGECDANFIPIAITDVLSKWLGESERHLHEIFESARRRAPSVIFIDEIDAIGVSRADAPSIMAPIVNVLLTEMDGISVDNRNVMILGATNTPWRVDSALRRPGRFDRVVFVPPPDEAARAAILDIFLRDIPAEAVDTAKLARQTDKFSGADIRGLVARASEVAIMTEMKTGAATKVTQKMLLDAIKDLRPSTLEWVETARNYASYANRSGLYDDLIKYLEGR